MSTGAAISAAQRRKFCHCLFKPSWSASPVVVRYVSTEARPEPPPSSDNESTVTQALQLLQTSDHEWASCQPLHSLLFLSSPPSKQLFRQIIRRLPSSSQALSFFNYLKQSLPSQDTHLLSSTFKVVLELASRESDYGTKLSELYRASKEWELPITVDAAMLFIRSFGRAGMPDESTSVFDALDKSLKSTRLRNTYISVMLRAGRVDDALKVLDEMFQSYTEVPPDDFTVDTVFQRLLSRNRKGRDITEDEIIRLVQKFGQHNVFPNAIWLTQIITRLCRSERSDQALDILNELLKLHAPLEASSFNALLSGLGRGGNVERMNEVLVKMKESDTQPNIVTVGILVKQLCRFGRVGQAMEVFEMMTQGKESDGIVVQADDITCNTLIDGLCKVGRQEEGLSFKQRMMSQYGCKPNVVTYNCLIDGFCKSGEIERGKELFYQMKNEGLNPNVVTLNTLVNGMCIHGRTSSALQFFNEMQREGLKGNAATYSALINAFCNVNNIDKAIELFDQMSESGISADAVLYYSLITGFSRAGRMNDAANFFSRLKAAGFRPDVICYNQLISGFCKRKKLDRAYEIVKEMEESGMKPDSVTYNSLISHYSKAGDFSVAHKMMKKMTKEGIIPNVVTCGALIHAYCLHGKLDEAMKIFREMSSASKVPPNTVIYNILIESQCNNNCVKAAISLMDEMKMKEVRPNTNTYNAMFKGLRDNNMLNKAFEIMDRMIQDACNPDYMTMGILTEWLSATGELEKLKKFSQGYQVSASA